MFFFFFFSSRRRHTRYIGDWSSDVCSSDLYVYQFNFGIQRKLGQNVSVEADYQGSAGHKLTVLIDENEPAVIVRDPTRRSEERRVGKECRSRGATCQ